MSALAISGVALVMAAWFFIKTMIYGVDLPGYASLMVSIAFFSGVQLLSLGVIGEYIGADFRRGERTPALSRRRADRRGASNKGLTRAC